MPGRIDLPFTPAQMHPQWPRARRLGFPEARTHGTLAPMRRIRPVPASGDGVDMTLAMFVTWIAIAVVSGWAAGIVAKNGGHGTTADLLLAVVGSGVASGIAAGLDLFPQAGLTESALVALLGAIAVIAAQRKFFSAPG